MKRTSVLFSVTILGLALSLSVSAQSGYVLAGEILGGLILLRARRQRSS